MRPAAVPSSWTACGPRAGHRRLQEGLAGRRGLRAGHPVYFVIFFPGRNRARRWRDVCAPRPSSCGRWPTGTLTAPSRSLMGNCQGGWATMLLAARTRTSPGRCVINGAPMSYWSGDGAATRARTRCATRRAAGRLLGGPARVRPRQRHVRRRRPRRQFRGLNPANTLWNKYYHLYANVDTEPPRFLEFERWWGGYFLMNEEEIAGSSMNLFVGNGCGRGGEGGAGTLLRPRRSPSPIIVFSSGGDNITPPQQALNWVADVYGSTEEIKANGQVIVGLFHKDVGHLGIFVSGKVAKKEHAQIVEVLEYIEALRPGLYLMEIEEVKGADGKVRVRRWRSRSAGWRTCAGPTRWSARTRSRSRPWPRCRTWASGPTACSLRPFAAAVRQRGAGGVAADVPPAPLAALGGQRPQPAAVAVAALASAVKAARGAAAARATLSPGREGAFRGADQRGWISSATCGTRRWRHCSSRSTAASSPQAWWTVPGMRRAGRGGPARAAPGTGRPRRHRHGRLSRGGGADRGPARPGRRGASPWPGWSWSIASSADETLAHLPADAVQPHPGRAGGDRRAGARAGLQSLPMLLANLEDRQRPWPCWTRRRREGRRRRSRR